MIHADKVARLQMERQAERQASASTPPVETHQPQYSNFGVTKTRQQQEEDLERERQQLRRENEAIERQQQIQRENAERERKRQEAAESSKKGKGIVEKLLPVILVILVIAV